MAEPSGAGLPLLVVHVPKTGGTTLRGHLQHVCGRQRVLEVYGAPAERAFTGAPLPSRREVAAVFTHGRIGTYLPHRPAPIGAMLRDPIERVLSDYRFARSWIGDDLHRAAMRLDPVAYARAGLRRDLADGQTWLLSDSPADGNGPLPDAHRQEALAHLDATLTWIGLSERFDESLALLCLEHDLEPSPYARANRSIDRSGDGLDARSRAEIAAANPSDVVLYAAAAERFAERWRASGREGQRALERIRRSPPTVRARRVALLARERARQVAASRGRA